MSDELLKRSTVIPPACRFFRDVFDDPSQTDHDRTTLVEHLKECSGCAKAIGNAIITNANAGDTANQE